MANSIPRIDTILNNEIAIGETKLVDSLPILQIKHLDYSIYFYDNSNTVQMHRKLSVSVQNANVEHQVYVRQGNQLNVELIPSSDGTTFLLNLKNNDVLPLKVKILRTLI